MTSERLRLVIIAAIVFVFLPWFITHRLARDAQARQITEGKSVIRNYAFLTKVPRTESHLVQNETIQAFLTKEENKDIILKNFTQLTVRGQGEGSRIIMAMAADMAPHVLEEGGESIKKYIREKFVMPIPQRYLERWFEGGMSDVPDYEEKIEKYLREKKLLGKTMNREQQIDFNMFRLSLL
ncbi:MAG: hypothetical protein ACLFQK_01350, partial [Fibrobacterota bacterium]